MVRVWEVVLRCWCKIMVTGRRRRWWRSEGMSLTRNSIGNKENTCLHLCTACTYVTRPPPVLILPPSYITRHIDADALHSHIPLLSIGAGCGTPYSLHCVFTRLHMFIGTCTRRKRTSDRKVSSQCLTKSYGKLTLTSDMYGWARTKVSSRVWNSPGKSDHHR